MSEKLIEKVIVRFPGDNDFHRIMFEFGHILLRFEKNANRYYTPNTFTKQEVAEFFNSIATPIYKFFCDGKNALVDYLTIEEKDVYINEEVDEVLKTYSQWGNGDSVFIDYWRGEVSIL